MTFANRCLRWLHHRLEAIRAEIHAAQACATLHSSVRLHAESAICNLASDPTRIVVGENSHLRGELLVFPDAGRITTGPFCYVGSGSRIWSRASITIGHHVLISHLVDIHDTDSHPLDAGERRRDIERLFGSGREPVAANTVQSSPVVIGDDVWIACKATILKGTTIGRGAVVAAGAVVTHDVEPFTLVAGNPARPIRTLAE